MPQSQQKYLFDSPTNGEIARVCASIIRAVKADNPGLTNNILAAKIGAKDKGVIERLENAETEKVPASLIIAIGHEFGGEYIDPFMRLMGLKAIPQHQQQAINAIPALGALIAKVSACATHGLDHVALAGMLQELREADGVISALRARASELGLAA